MALSDPVLSENLQALYTLMEQEPMSIKNYADKMALILDTQTKTADVNTGITVSIPTTSQPGSPSTGQTTSKGVIL